MSAADLPHFVYRCYDIDGDLLYVGCSKDVEARMRTHRRSHNSWVPEMVGMVVEEFPDRATALTAESDAIANENPYWNTMGRWQERGTWTELEFERWGHMLNRSTHPDGWWNQTYLQDLDLVFKMRFGKPFPANPRRGLSRPRLEQLGRVS